MSGGASRAMRDLLEHRMRAAELALPKPQPIPKRIIVNPETLRGLTVASISAAVGRSGGDPSRLYGLPVYIDPKMPRFASRWQPPRERFVEYEERDEIWLRYFGLGGIVETREPLVFVEMMQP